MQKHSKNCYYKAKYCQKHQSFDADIPKSSRNTLIIWFVCQFIDTSSLSLDLSLHLMAVI